MLNDPQKIARNRATLDNLKQEVVREEQRLVQLRKEANHIGALKEDLEVERVLISQNRNKLTTLHNEFEKDRKALEQKQNQLIKDQNSFKKQRQEQKDHHELSLKNLAGREEDLSKSDLDLQERQLKWGKTKTAEQTNLEQANQLSERRQQEVTAKENLLNKRDSELNERAVQYKDLELLTDNLIEEQKLLSDAQELLANKENEIAVAGNDLENKRVDTYELREQLDERSNIILKTENRLNEAAAQIEKDQEAFADLTIRQEEFDAQNFRFKQDRKQLTEDEDSHLEEVIAFESESENFEITSTKTTEEFRLKKDKLDEQMAFLAIQEEQMEQRFQYLMYWETHANHSIKNSRNKIAQVQRAANRFKQLRNHLSQKTVRIQNEQSKLAREKIEIRKLARKFIDITS